MSDRDQIGGNLNGKYKVWFFAGGETRDNRFNIFTGSFIRLMKKIMEDAGLSPETQLIITSSSSGSIVAAQTACYLAQKNRNNVYFRKPFHLVLGASMISSRSDLYKKLIHYQRKGTIGIILHDEVQDHGDSSAGVGGISKLEAYRNAFGLMFPFLSRKFKGPSFLNTNPETGHIHRRRSRTTQKAIDYINIILIERRLAGDYYKGKALEVIKGEII